MLSALVPRILFLAAFLRALHWDAVVVCGEEGKFHSIKIEKLTNI
jgi:hypothetical protein